MSTKTEFTWKREGESHLWIFVPLNNILPAAMCVQHVQLEATRELLIGWLQQAWKSEGKDIFIFLFLNKNSHIFSTLDFILLCIYVLPGMAPKFMSTSDTSNKSLLIPSLGSSGFSASLSLLASFNISGLKSCLNIHLATLSAMPPTVWRQEGKWKFTVFAKGNQNSTWSASPYREISVPHSCLSLKVTSKSHATYSSVTACHSTGEGKWDSWYLRAALDSHTIKY